MFAVQAFAQQYKYHIVKRGETTTGDCPAVQYF